MLNWLKGKLQSGRIATWNIQLASELEQMTASDVALVVVKGIDFCLSFRQHDDGIDGIIRAKVIEEPSKHLAEDGAQELYWKLEDILFAAQRELEPTLKQAKATLPATAYGNFAKGVALNHISLRLLMSRVSHAFKAADAKYIAKIGGSLRATRPLIDDAVKTFKADHIAAGISKEDGFYTFVRDSAYNYAATYPS